jgi:hypothetical protein
MKALIFLFVHFPLAALLLCAPAEMSGTDYSSKRTLNIVRSASLEMETTEFSIERDGEPIGSNFMGGSSSLEERTIEESFTVLEQTEGRPTRVRRAFETITRDTTSEMGEETMESSSEGPLQGVTIEVFLEDDEVLAEVVDGDEPDDEAVLEAHSLTLTLDGLLPEGEVEEDDAWDLESDAIRTALGLDLEDAYFPREERTEEEDGGEGRRGRRGSWRTSRSSAMRPLLGLEWSGEATYEGETEHDGVTCMEFALEIEAEGELEDPSFGGGRRGGRAPQPVLGAAPLETTITVELEGRLLFNAEDGLPVLLDLEGTVESVRHSEMDRGESTITTHMVQEGAFVFRVEISAESEE